MNIVLGRARPRSRRLCNWERL